jgi:uncharacterized membrane protein
MEKNDPHEDNRPKNWHQVHSEKMTIGERVADWMSQGMGSWPFIIVQTIFVLLWMTVNAIGWALHWDPYPFILLNLMFSIQAAYAAPIIMMSQNRQNQRDREQARQDLETDIRSRKGVEQLHKMIARIEIEKLDKIITLLESQN